eukprot:14016762-Alexandrium_andersonii.AAC.1
MAEVEPDRHRSCVSGSAAPLQKEKQPTRAFPGPELAARLLLAAACHRRACRRSVAPGVACAQEPQQLSLIHISEPTRLALI